MGSVGTPNHHNIESYSFVIICSEHGRQKFSEAFKGFSQIFAVIHLLTWQHLRCFIQLNRAHTNNTEGKAEVRIFDFWDVVDLFFGTETMGIYQSCYDPEGESSQITHNTNWLIICSKRFPSSEMSLKISDHCSFFPVSSD